MWTGPGTGTRSDWEVGLARAVGFETKIKVSPLSLLLSDPLGSCIPVIQFNINLVNLGPVGGPSHRSIVHKLHRVKIIITCNNFRPITSYIRSSISFPFNGSEEQSHVMDMYTLDTIHTYNYMQWYMTISNDPHPSHIMFHTNYI